MRESLLEGQKVALFRSIVRLGEDRDCSPDFQGVIHVVKQGFVAMAVAHDRHIAARGPDQPPLDLARHEERWVGQEMKPRLERKQKQEGELVEPVQVVGDDYVVARALWDVLATLDLELKAQPKERNADQADDPIGKVGPAANRE